MDCDNDAVPNTGAMPSAWKEPPQAVEFKGGCVATGRVCVLSFALGTLAICGVTLGGGVELVRAGPHTAIVRHIKVTGDDHDLDVDITATKPIVPRTQIVTDPDRLIVDLPEARPGSGLRKIAVNRGELRNVRVGLLSANPPITRVVLDLTAPTDYHVSPLANTIVVKLGSQSGVAGAPTAPTTNPKADATPAETAPAETTPAETTPPVSPPPPPQSSEPSFLHWVMPILVVTAVMAMLVIAVVVHLQNKRSGRGF